MMTFTESVRTVLSKYFDFSGRATRPEFWWWVLFVLIVSVVLQIIDGAVIAPMLGFGAFSPDAGNPLSLVASLALLIPGLAVGVRRLHDIGRSGWWILIVLVPLIGLLVLIYWHVQPSEESQNAYG